MERELKIVAPDGYEIDRENSTLERIVFKKKPITLPKSWSEFCLSNLRKDGESFIATDSSIIGNQSTGPRFAHSDKTCYQAIRQRNSILH